MLLKLRLWPLLFVALLCSCGTPQQLELRSPDGNVSVHVQVREGRAEYSLSMKGTALLLNSNLGLTVNGEDFHSQLTLVEINKPSVHREDYVLSHGKQAQVSYLANEQWLLFENADHKRLGLRLRLSDKGLAFRYELHAAKTQSVQVSEEFTSFAFPPTARAYLQEMAVAQTGWNHTNPSYEEFYQIDIPVGTASPSSAGWVFPALFKSAGQWLLISEAGMRGDWHASRLQANSEGGVYRVGSPMPAEVTQAGGLTASGTTPLLSPWRLIAIGELADIVNSSLGTDLADPAKFAATEFLPGLASWSWAMLKDDSVNFETSKQFIDYAARMHWPYTLIDADWDRRIGEDGIRELAAYAAGKNVGLLLWYNSAGNWNTTPYTPRDKLLDTETRRAEFSKLKEIGIKGIKIDFFPGDGQSVIQYYKDLLSDAADFSLLVNFHGATLPRGLSRTYPNLMTMEAIRGFEFITFSQETADRAAEHMAMLPFTRNVFDPMDFTPTTFSEIPNIERRTTNGFEAALPVLFLSGIQHIAETAENMALQPEWLQEYMANIPVLWDESRLLSGEPGKHAVIARRKAKNWYVVGINGENQALQLSLDLSFLNNQTGTIFFDKGPRQLEKTELVATPSVQVPLLPQGGFVMLFKGDSTQK